MVVLKYITKGNRSPQGLPRVYFCCHPAEQGRFLEPVAKSILDRQSCAVFYPEDPEGVRDEEFWSDLKQIQLFVMPVTTRLLTTDNPAMEEFRFAIQNHIPVLPLMQEPGLDTLFNEKCGDLQFLDPNAKDETAISYEEKLTKYLQSVLIGDEMAQRIRDAFDAYVFLSYRKKDRRYAQELMRLIHRNDFCRDIAIWYDEFLVPGENFNDAIREALRKSDLFVLTVTPNLVNEENYVMTTEYPMAQSEGKPVLPAVMVETDGAALKNHYPDIPASTNAHDEAALTTALLEVVKKLAIRENDTSPEHNLFIGLAYLGGVDVEVDYERALSLITSSAEAGLVEAIIKLVEMYEYGRGVAVDFRKMVFWQEKLVSALQEIPSKDPSHHLSLIRNQVALANDYHELKEYGKAFSCLQVALDFTEAAQKELKPRLTPEEYRDFTREIDRIEATIFEKAGNIGERIGNMEFAFEAYTHAIKARKRYNTGSQTDIRALISGYYRLGILRKQQGHYFLARVALKKGCMLCRQFYRHFGEYPPTYSRILLQLGMVAIKQGKTSVCKKYYWRAIEHLRRKIAEYPEDAWFLSTMSECYVLLSMCAKERGEVMEYLTTGLDLIDRSLKRQNTYSANEEKGLILEMLHGEYRRAGDYDKALQYIKAAVENAQTMHEMVNNSSSASRLAAVLVSIARHHRDMGNPDEAQRAAERARKLIMDFNPENEEAQRALGCSLEILATLREPANTELLEQAAVIWAALKELNPELYSHAYDQVCFFLEQARNNGQ